MNANYDDAAMTDLTCKLFDYGMFSSDLKVHELFAMPVLMIMYVCFFVLLFNKVKELKIASCIAFAWVVAQFILRSVIVTFSDASMLGVVIRWAVLVLFSFGIFLYLYRGAKILDATSPKKSTFPKVIALMLGLVWVIWVVPEILVWFYC